jgi:hypothetical protein
VITFWGLVVSVMFMVCYLGQSVSSGMPPSRGRILMWGCWMAAALTMMVCYMVTRVTVG